MINIDWLTRISHKKSLKFDLFACVVIKYSGFVVSVASATASAAPDLYFQFQFRNTLFKITPHPGIISNLLTPKIQYPAEA